MAMAGTRGERVVRAQARRRSSHRRPSPLRVELPVRQAVLAWTALVLGLLVVPAAALPALGPAVRFPIVLAFVCAGPGSAFVSLVRLGDPVSSWVTAFVLSLALNGLLASAMVWTGWWSAAGGYAALGLPTAITAALALWPAFRRLLPWSADPRHDPSPVRPARSIDRRVAPGGAVRPIPHAGPRGALSDATAMLPRLADATTVLPRVADAPAPDATRVIPRVTDATAWDATTMLPRVAQEPPRSGRAAGAAVVLAVAALATWLASVTLTSLDHLDTYGLLPVLDPAFFAALALCALGFLVELNRPHRRGWLLASFTAILILIMKATVPLLVPVPAYSWTYKHVGVAELFRLHGEVTNGSDLYQQWPTLFALVAHIVAATGIDVLTIALWAPVFFAAAFCVPLFGLARTLATDPRVPYLTVFVYAAVNWVGQDYLAPQAFAFVLALGTLLIIVRWLRRTSGANRRPGGFVGRLWSVVATGLAPVPYTSRYAARAATVAMSVVFLVVVAAHQLTPYFVAMGAVALVALGLVRSYRIIPIVVGLAIGYLVPRYEVVDDYGLFSGFNLFSNAQTTAVVANASAGRVLSGEVARLMALVMLGLAALAVVSSWRRPGPVALPALLAFAPFGMLVAQSYGGEATFRVILFSSPWCAMLIAMLVVRRPWLPGGVGVPLGAAALALAVIGSMQASHGQLLTTTFSRNEVAISRYLYAHAEPGSLIVLAADNFPTRLTADYGSFREESLVGPRERLSPFELSPAGAQALDQHFDDSVATYLVLTPSMTRYLEYYGYMEPDTVTTLGQLVEASPLWEQYHRIGDAVIYRRAPDQLDGDGSIGPPRTPATPATGSPADQTAS